MRPDPLDDFLNQPHPTEAEIEARRNAALALHHEIIEAFLESTVDGTLFYALASNRLFATTLTSELLALIFERLERAEDIGISFAPKDMTVDERVAGLAREQLANSLFYQGKVSEREGDLPGAIACFLAVNRLEISGPALACLGGIYRRMGRTQEAWSLLVRAYALSPHSDRIGVSHAEALVEQGLRNEAVEVLERVLARNKIYGPAHRLLAKIR